MWIWLAWRLDQLERLIFRRRRTTTGTG